jgi:DNA-binding FadR family transcriptional regulator
VSAVQRTLPVQHSAAAGAAVMPKLLPRSVSRPRMRDGVVEAVLNFIVQEDLDAGYLLPSEGEMARLFGASRTVVREALGVLEEKRVLRVLHGKGALVTARDEWNVLDSQVLAADLRFGFGSRLTDELVRSRMWIEQELAAEAATNASPAELDALDAHLERMRELRADLDAYSELDLDFHQMIANASHNRVGTSVMFALVDPLRLVRRKMTGLPGASDKAHRDHEVILQRLRARDADGARTEIHRHIEWTRELWRTMVGQGVRDHSAAAGGS